MSDNYQAVFDAVRSKITNGDIGEAVSRVLRMYDFGGYFERALTVMAADIYIAQTRPSVLFRPDLIKDVETGMWCAMYWVREGGAGYFVVGETPEKAMEAFDKGWKTQKAMWDSVKP